MTRELKIKETIGNGGCDCCGSYSWTEIEISVEGKEPVRLYGDYHLAGEADISIENQIKTVLQLFDIDAKVTHIQEYKND